MRGRILLISLLLPAVAAQDVEDGCTQAAPCPWAFDVDAGGIDDGSDAPAWNFTSGDWVALEVFNFDDVPHTISVAGMSWTIESLDGLESEAFQFQSPGEFTLVDEPSGDAAPVSILADDSLSSESEAPAARNVPSVGPLAILGSLGAIAIVARRR